MLHHLARATIQVANLANYNCHPLEDDNKTEERCHKIVICCLELIVTLEALPIIIKHSGNTNIKFHAGVPCSYLKIRGYSSVKTKTKFTLDLRRLHFR